MNKKYLITFGLLGLIGLGTLAAGMIGLSTGATFALPTLITAGAILGAMILGALMMFIAGLIKKNTKYQFQGLTSLFVLSGLSSLVVGGLSAGLSIPASTTSLLASSSTTSALPPSTIFMIAGGIALLLAVFIVGIGKARAREKVDTKKLDQTTVDTDEVPAANPNTVPAAKLATRTQNFRASDERHKWDARNKVTDEKVRATRVLSFLETRLLNPADKGVTASVKLLNLADTASANKHEHFCLQLSQEAIASAIDVYKGDYDIMEQTGQKETQGQVNQIKPNSSETPVAVDSNFMVLYRYPKDGIELKPQETENCPTIDEFNDKTQDKIDIIHNRLNLPDVLDACIDFHAQKAKNIIRVAQTINKLKTIEINAEKPPSCQALMEIGSKILETKKTNSKETEEKTATFMGEENQGGSNDADSESFESMAEKWGLHKLFTHWSDRGKNSVELLEGMRNKLQDSSNSEDKSKSNSAEKHLKLTIVGRTNTVDEILEEMEQANQQNTAQIQIKTQEKKQQGYNEKKLA